MKCVHHGDRHLIDFELNDQCCVGSTTVKNPEVAACVTTG